MIEKGRERELRQSTTSRVHLHRYSIISSIDKKNDAERGKTAEIRRSGKMSENPEMSVFHFKFCGTQFKTNVNLFCTKSLRKGCLKNM